MKLFSNSLQNAVSSIKTQAAGAAAVLQRPVPTASTTEQDKQDKQFLRLPIESARKLRWYDKGDLSAIVRDHLREKRELQQTITHLKRLLVRHGLSEADVDMETRALLHAAAESNEHGEGVYSVLLAGAMTRIEELEAVVEQGQAAGHQAVLSEEQRAAGSVAGLVLEPAILDRLSAVLEQVEAYATRAVELQQAACKLGLQYGLSAAHPSSSSPAQDAAATSADSAQQQTMDTAEVVGQQQGKAGSQSQSTQKAAGNSWDTQWGDDEATAEAEATAAGTMPQGDAGTEQCREGDAEVTPLARSAQSAEPGVCDSQGSGGSVQGLPAAKHQVEELLQAFQAESEQLAQACTQAKAQAASIRSELAKLQRAASAAAAAGVVSAEAHLGISADGSHTCASTESLSVAAAHVPPRPNASLGASTEHVSVPGQTLTQATQHTGSRSRSQAAPAPAPAQPSAPAHTAALARLQDACVEAEETARSEARRASLAEARAAKLESELREVIAAAKAASKSCSALQTQLNEAKDKVTSQAAVINALQVSQMSRSESSAREAAALAADKAAKVSAAAQAAAVAEAKREAESQLAAAQAELQALRSQLAQRSDEVAALSARERDLSAMHAAALRDLQQDARAARSVDDNLKKACLEQSAARMRVEDELLTTAQMASALELKLAHAQARALAAEDAQAQAEARARAAESSIGREIEARMAAAVANRAMWPAAIQAAFAEQQAALGDASDRLREALASAQSLQAKVEDLESEKAVLEAAMHDTTISADRAHAHASARLSQLEEQIEMQTQECTAAQRSVEALTSERAALWDQLSALQAALTATAAARREAAAAHTSANGDGVISSGGDGGGIVTAGSQAFLLGTPPAAQAQWQVQNPVGDGSLYGLAAKAFAAGAHPGGGGAGAAHRLQRMEGAGQEGAASGAGTGHQAIMLARKGSNQSGGPLDRVNSSMCLVGHGLSPSSSNVQLTGTAPMRGGPHDLSAGGAAVDTIYLKNVILKFLEAHVSGKLSERDALLPAVATLLHATPAEFRALKAVVANTTQPVSQMLSAFGFKL